MPDTGPQRPSTQNKYFEKFGERLIFGKELGRLRNVTINNDPVMAIIGDINVPRVVRRDRGGAGQVGRTELGQVIAVGIEFLDPVIRLVGHEKVAAAVQG